MAKLLSRLFNEREDFDESDVQMLSRVLSSLNFGRAAMSDTTRDMFPDANLANVVGIVRGQTDMTPGIFLISGFGNDLKFIKAASDRQADKWAQLLLDEMVDTSAVESGRSNMKVFRQMPLVAYEPEAICGVVSKGNYVVIQGRSSRSAISLPAASKEKADELRFEILDAIEEHRMRGNGLGDKPVFTPAP